MRKKILSLMLASAIACSGGITGIPVAYAVTKSEAASYKLGATQEVEFVEDEEFGVWDSMYTFEGKTGQQLVATVKVDIKDSDNNLGDIDFSIEDEQHNQIITTYVNEDGFVSHKVPLVSGKKYYVYTSVQSEPRNYSVSFSTQVSNDPNFMSGTNLEEDKADTVKLGNKYTGCISTSTFSDAIKDSYYKIKATKDINFRIISKENYASNGIYINAKIGKDGEYTIVKNDDSVIHADAGQTVYIKISPNRSRIGVNYQFELKGLNKKNLAPKIILSDDDSLYMPVFINGKYQLFVSSSKSGKYKMVKETTDTHFTLSNFLKKGTYYCKVKAIYGKDSGISRVYKRTVED